MTVRLRRTAALLVVAGTLVIGACGVPLDSSPRAVTASSSTTEATNDQANTEEGDTAAFLFFIANNQLINVAQEVPSRSVDDALGALFAGVPSSAADDVVSQIPTGTRLLGVTRIGTLLDVDVSKEFDNLVGTGRSQATAQIVMTATDIAGIDQVSLRIEGQPTQVFSQIRGDTDQVGACDYLGLMPPDDLVQSWALDRRSKQHLTTRHSMLSTQCTAPPAADN